MPKPPDRMAQPIPAQPNRNRQNHKPKTAMPHTWSGFDARSTCNSVLRVLRCPRTSA
ncbi:hypothetical protein BGZ61DRAFT_458041 [Ilyonectria robusta]|uniref:uncharacterized protein n=1 Tax=Ilyonectria robusta TaxID=1079257 RepID=UPI001E8EA016|nr:uncharacterized protein BGZ61DRAFT_458041 [Ilyonectria robusta]KAH8674927.1 hypothetical protein BGZ61DRAFT_458041 [Ilyonectria robusta]